MTMKEVIFYLPKSLGINNSNFNIYIFIGLLLFPFAQKDWAIKYNQDEPVQPKYDVNAPDLYIPCMGYITYILMVGYILGLKNAFR